MRVYPASVAVGVNVKNPPSLELYATHDGAEDNAAPSMLYANAEVSHVPPVEQSERRLHIWKSGDGEESMPRFAGSLRYTFTVAPYATVISDLRALATKTNLVQSQAGTA